MNIPEIINEHHLMMTERGFHEIENRNVSREDHIGELLAMVVGELCGEALEAHRTKKFADNREICNLSTYDNWNEWFLDNWKDTFEDEICDVFLRLFDLCGYLDIEPDIHRVITGDVKYWDNLKPENNIGESLIRITVCITDIFNYTYLNNVKYKDMVSELFNFALWRLNRLCEILKIPIEKHIVAKMEYNKTREHKHGKEY